ncbi:MAG: mechanosensitive ion channel domain-containing protein [Idiomarina sp.]
MQDTLLTVWQHIQSVLGIRLFGIGETDITIGGICQMVIIVIAAWLISYVSRKSMQRYGRGEQRMAAASLYTLTRISHYFIMMIGFVVAIASLGVDLTKFALLASAVGIGVGFGLQNLISNFVAGIMLLFEKTLKVNDFVELESGVTGEVKEINIRSTIITTNDNIDIVVPNSEFVNGRVTNWTMRDTYRRVHIPFGVAYGSDKNLVKEAVLEAASNVPHTLTGTSHRPPQVWLTEMGDSALNFELVVWLKPEAVNRPGAVKAAFNWEIHTALLAAGLEIPFPQRDLHIRSWSKPSEVDLNEAADKVTDEKTDEQPDQQAQASSAASDNDAAKDI